MKNWHFWFQFKEEQEKKFTKKMNIFFSLKIYSTIKVGKKKEHYENTIKLLTMSMEMMKKMHSTPTICTGENGLIDIQNIDPGYFYD